MDLVRNELAFGLLVLGIFHVTHAAIVQVSNCDGYSAPSGCTRGANCAFEASWRLFDAGPLPQDPTSNKTLAVVFTVTIRRATERAANFYTALGFSDNQAMPETDVVFGYAYNNNFLEVLDAYIEPGQIKAPLIDQRQDVFNFNGSLVDDPYDRTKRVLTFSFVRRLDTGDPYQDISLMQCRYFFFVTGGGAVSGPRAFYKHDATPDMSREKICLTKCLGPQPGGSANSSSSAWMAVIAAAIVAVFLHV